MLLLRNRRNRRSLAEFLEVAQTNNSFLFKDELEFSFKRRKLAELIIDTPKELTQKSSRSQNQDLNAKLCTWLGTFDDPFLGGELWEAIQFNISFRNFARDVISSKLGSHCFALLQRAGKDQPPEEFRANETSLVAGNHFLLKLGAYFLSFQS